MDKLKMHTADITDANIQKIGELFPNCLTERLDENGKPERAIDFDKLKQELSKEIVEGPQERYQFTWPGKREAMRLANTPTNMTLRPCREDSVDFDNTENLYIEGDNLEVLKLLRENYLGKVKIIYIDPPYNTGKDFVYMDDFAQDVDDYKDNSGQKDEFGNRMVQNTESNGRFHSDWLNMMYSRLKLAKDLLAKDGVVFISIDDHEFRNIRYICDELYGEDNYVNNFMWLHGKGKKDSWSRTLQQYIVAYAKNKSDLVPWNDEAYTNYDFSNPDNDPKGKWFSGSLSFSEERSNPNHPNYYSITSPTGVKWERQWQVSREEMQVLIESGDISWGDSIRMDGVPRQKIRPSVIDIIPNNIFDECGTTKSAQTDLSRLMGCECFSYPKPVDLLLKILEITTMKDAIVLDFFSGSGTTAHATLQLNAKDKGTRKFIMVQLKEDLEKNLSKVDAYEKNIIKNAIKLCDTMNKEYFLTEVAKERIRRAGKKIKEESGLMAENLDTGFRVLKLDTSNMEDVYYKPEEFSELQLFEDNVKPDRTPEDLLFQVMLECNLPLSAKIEKKIIAGKEVFNVNEGYLIACFDKDVNEQVITEVAKQQPYYFVMRDSSLSSDNVADNFEQIFNAYSKDTIRKIL